MKDDCPSLGRRDLLVVFWMKVIQVLESTIIEFYVELVDIE